MSTNPKIGIRPIIDGRAAERSNLEELTMNMAVRAAGFISENLRYPSGEFVECVIADTTISGSAQARDCAEKFARANVVGTLSVTSCWCYGSETMDLDPNTVKAVWGFNGTESPGTVYLAAVMAAHAQKGVPAFSIYGRDVQDKGDTEIPPDVQEKLLSFARCAIAVGIMRGKSYMNIGSVSMGICVCRTRHISRWRAANLSPDYRGWRDRYSYCSARFYACSRARAFSPRSGVPLQARCRPATRYGALLFYCPGNVIWPGKACDGARIDHIHHSHGTK